MARTCQGMARRSCEAPLLGRGLAMCIVEWGNLAIFGGENGCWGSVSELSQDPAKTGCKRPLARSQAVQDAVGPAVMDRYARYRGAGR